MPRSRTAWLAWFLWALAVAQAISSLLLALLNRVSLERLFAEYVVAGVAAALAFATVGAIIATRRPGNAVGWLCCVAGTGAGVVAWTGQYARYALVTRPDALPGGVVMLWLNSWVWVLPAAAAAIFLPLLFPDGRLPSTRWRPLAWQAAGATALLTASVALGPVPSRDDLPAVSSPLAFEGARVLLDGMNGLAILLLLTSLAGAVAAQVVRFRRARGDERQQIKWVAYATALLVGAIVTRAALDPSSVAEDTLLSGIVLGVAYPGLPVAVGIAVLRYRLYDIDLIINRTLVYGALTTLLALVYFGSAVALQATFRTLTGQDSNLAIVVATLVSAALFQPLRQHLQGFIDRRFYRRKYDAAHTLAAFSARLRDEVDLTMLSEELVRVVDETMQPSHVSLWLRLPTRPPSGHQPRPR